MMNARSRGMLPRTAMLLGTSCLGVALSAPAGADTRANVLVSGGLRYETAPYLGASDDNGTLGATVEVTPSVFFVDEITRFRISGNLAYDLYFDGVRDNERVQVSADGQTRLDERTGLSGGLQFLSSQSYAQNSLFVGTDDLIALEPDEVPEFPLIDPTVAGTGRRISTLSVRGALTRTISPIDSLSVGLSAQGSATEGDFGRDYRSAGASLGYARQLSERTRLQANVSVNKNDYLDQERGDSYSITPLVGISQQISPTLSWSGQVGVSYANIDDGFGNREENVDFALSVNGCKRGVRGNLCFGAARDATPTTFGGLSTSTSVNVQYDRQLSLNGRINLLAAYRRSERILEGDFIEDDDIGLNRSSELLSAGARYRHTFTQRLSAFANVSYSKPFTDTFDRDGNFQTYLGVSYLFGDVR